MSAFMSPLTRCVECKQSTDRNGYGTLDEIVGYVERRRGGGVHHVRFKKLTGRVMCGDCARRRRDTGNAQQESLL